MNQEDGEENLCLLIWCQKLLNEKEDSMLAVAGQEKGEIAMIGFGMGVRLQINTSRIAG